VVFDAAFTNISFISWLSVLLLGEIGGVFRINKTALEQREFLFCVHIIQKTEWMHSLELKSECKK
jgi:hypothetical protein